MLDMCFLVDRASSMVYCGVMELKQHLEQRGVSIGDFASAIHVSYEAGRRYVNKERTPRPRIARRIILWSGGAVAYMDLLPDNGEGTPI